MLEAFVADRIAHAEGLERARHRRIVREMLEPRKADEMRGKGMMAMLGAMMGSIVGSMGGAIGETNVMGGEMIARGVPPETAMKLAASARGQTVFVAPGKGRRQHPWLGHSFDVAIAQVNGIPIPPEVQRAHDKRERKNARRLAYAAHLAGREFAKNPTF